MTDTTRPTTQETTNSLAFFVGLSHSYTVDDEGYVVDSRDMEHKHMIKGAGANDPKRALVIYSERMPHPVDYYIVNPYAESLGLSTPSNTFFYNCIRVAAMVRLKTVIEGTIRYMQIQKGIDVDNPMYAVVGNPKCLMDAAAGFDQKNRPIMELVDDKTFTNISNYLKSSQVLRDFMYVSYTKKQMVSALRIEFLTDPDFADTHDMGKLRKSDTQVLRGILMAVLKLKTVQDLEKYVEHATEDAPAKMSSWLKVIFKLYKAINPVLAVVKDDLVVDLSEFKHHLDRIVGYANNAKWMIQANGPTATTGQPTIPGAAAAPQIPGATPTYPGYPPQQAGYPGVPNVPPPVRADGTTVQTPWSGYGQPSSVPPPMVAQPQQPQWGMPQQPVYPGFAPQQPSVYPGFPPQQNPQQFGQWNQPSMYPGYPSQPQGYGNVPPPMMAQPQTPFYGVPGAPPGVY